MSSRGSNPARLRVERLESNPWRTRSWNSGNGSSPGSPPLRNGRLQGDGAPLDLKIAGRVESLDPAPLRCVPDPVAIQCRRFNEREARPPRRRLSMAKGRAGRSTIGSHPEGGARHATMQHRTGMSSQCREHEAPAPAPGSPAVPRRPHAFGPRLPDQLAGSWSGGRTRLCPSHREDSAMSCASVATANRSENFRTPFTRDRLAGGGHPLDELQQILSRSPRTFLLACSSASGGRCGPPGFTGGSCRRGDGVVEETLVSVAVRGLS